MYSINVSLFLDECFVFHEKAVDPVWISLVLILSYECLNNFS
jgi:hypothetical protein